MSDRSRLRLFILQILVLSLFLTLVSRLWFLQILDSRTYVAKQERTGKERIFTPAARGRILDAQGREIATNLATYVVSAQIKEFPGIGTKASRTERAKVVRGLAGLLQLDEQEIEDRTTLCEYKKNADGDFGLDKGVRGKCWNGSQYQPIPLLRDATLRQAFLIEEHAEDFPGVDATLEPIRSYPHGQLAAHMLGYVQASSDAKAGELAGRAGVELQYDEALKGTLGSKTLETDRSGAVTRELDTVDPRPGSDLVLSLDLNVQKVAEDALASHIERAHSITDPCKDCPTVGQKLKAPAGAAVVLEAKTGRVAAMASYPTYDPSKFLKGIKEGTADYDYLFDKKMVPQVSRAYQGEYAPGSTFKHVSTAAAVLNGHALNGAYQCPGSLQIGTDPKPKSNYEGIGIPGDISWRTALVQSCDTVYYKIAENDWAADEALIKARKKPNEHVQQLATRFGFGTPTGIDLPGEANGAIPTRKWLQELNARLHPDYCKRAKALPKESDQGKLFTDLCENGSRYRPGDQANTSVGQGYVLATPLQLAVSYASLVNGGNIMEPRVAKAVISPGGAKVQEIAPKVRSKTGVSPEILDYITNALADVPKEGTARCAFGKAPPTTDCKEVKYAAFPFDQLDVGGKTGTAEVSKKQDTSWFASFGPVADPRYVVVVMVEEGGTGGTVAAPATREIWDGIYGLEGKTAALENGALPATLPVILPDGRIRRPGTSVRQAPPVSVPPATTPSASTPAGSSSPIAPAPKALPAADLPPRREGSLT